MRYTKLILSFALIFLVGLAPRPSISQPKPKPQPIVVTESMVEEQHLLIKNRQQPSMNDTLVLMRNVCDWQLGHLRESSGKLAPASVDWIRGTFCAGLMATYYATTDLQYLRTAIKLSEENEWKPGPRPRHADDDTITQTYAEIYMLEKDPRMIEAMRHKFDQMMATPKPVREDWWWCDALFMAPPALARLSAATGDRKYLDYMNTMWLDTTDFLYDKSEHLYYRDKSFMLRPDGTQRLEKNGKKIFWSRGNGWVIAGICRILDYMPRDYPDRTKYIAIYKEMAEKLVSTQGKDGLWSASQLDPTSYPLGETSGSGFFCFALAWGINNGYLDETIYRPAVEKAWRGLAACVERSGKLGYSQHPAGSPQPALRDYSDEYTCGAFLLAGREMMKLMAGKAGKSLTIHANNGLSLARPSETIELSWKSMESRLPGLCPSRVCLRDMATGEEVLTQIIYKDDAPSSLIFQVDLGPGEEKILELALVVDRKPCRLADSKTYGTFVPTRKDDFAWENDRIAYRMYGPALQQTGEISSGIDVWVKSVRYPIIDKWYSSESGSYHVDHGEGLDCYKVGPSRGCGGIGIWEGDQLFASKNFTSWKILANGPIRTTFELTYDFWDTGGRKVSEIKRISLDAGSNLNRIESTFRSNKSGPFTIGIGLTGTKGVNKNPQKGILSCWEPTNSSNGIVGTGIIVDPTRVVDMIPIEGQTLALVSVSTGQLLIYHTGAGWSKSGDFNDDAAWQSYLINSSQRLRSPLEVTLK